MIKTTTIKLYEDGTITICPLNRHRGNLTEVQKEYRNQKLKEIGNKKKTFSLDSKAKRIIRCSAIRMFRSKKIPLNGLPLLFRRT